MKGTRLTPYRVAVYEALRATRYHPTAAEVFRLVRRRRPGVAHATIYNALNWLKENGLIRELKFGDAASRYDPILARHDHLHCNRCGALVDCQVDLPRSLWSRAGRHIKFQVQSYRVELAGLCGSCARTSSGRNGQKAMMIQSSWPDLAPTVSSGTSPGRPLTRS
jgi:Fur family peroxide stress response transcriptional regulator